MVNFNTEMKEIQNDIASQFKTVEPKEKAQWRGKILQALKRLIGKGEEIDLPKLDSKDDDFLLKTAQKIRDGVKTHLAETLNGTLEPDEQEALRDTFKLLNKKIMDPAKKQQFLETQKQLMNLVGAFGESIAPVKQGIEQKGEFKKAPQPQHAEPGQVHIGRRAVGPDVSKEKITHGKKVFDSAGSIKERFGAEGSSAIRETIGEAKKAIRSQPKEREKVEENISPAISKQASRSSPQYTEHKAPIQDQAGQRGVKFEAPKESKKDVGKTPEPEGNNQ